MSSRPKNIGTPNDEVALLLSRAQALVLLEFLSRYSNSNQLDVCDQAEQRVLWDMCARLEGMLTEPLRPDYDALLGAAREAVRDEES